MSALVVTKTHLDSLIATALYGPADQEEKIRQGRWHRLSLHDGRYKIDTAENATVLGKMVMRANHVGYHTRYQDSEGVVDWRDYDYRFPVATAKRLTVIQALKALECFGYQCSCAPDTDVVGVAIERFIHNFRAQLIRFLPGYDEAPWTIAA